MTDTVVCKLGPYHCQSTWTEDSVLLTVLAGDDAWAGELHQQACKDRDDRAGGALGDSWIMAREAFGGATQSKYDFAIENKKLIWRKVGGKAKIKITEIQLNPVSFLDAQNEILAQLVESNNELKSKNTDFKRRHGKTTWSEISRSQRKCCRKWKRRRVDLKIKCTRGFCPY